MESADGIAEDAEATGPYLRRPMSAGPPHTSSAIASLNQTKGSQLLASSSGPCILPQSIHPLPHSHNFTLSWAAGYTIMALERTEYSGMLVSCYLMQGWTLPVGTIGWRLISVFLAQVAASTGRRCSQRACSAGRAIEQFHRCLAGGEAHGRGTICIRTAQAGAAEY